MIIQAPIHPHLSLLDLLPMHLQAMLLKRALTIVVPPRPRSSIAVHIVIEKSSRALNVPSTLVAEDVVRACSRRLVQLGLWT